MLAGGIDKQYLQLLKMVNYILQNCYLQQYLLCGHELYLQEFCTVRLCIEGDKSPLNFPPYNAEHVHGTRIRSAEHPWDNKTRKSTTSQKYTINKMYTCLKGYKSFCH